jgi:ABC-2 type transport system permease protein/oleandomycin transport system permease protein
MSVATIAVQPPAGAARWASAVYDAAALTWRNVLRNLRNPAFLLTEVVVQPVVFTLLFAYVFGGAIHVPGTSYIDFLMPGIFVQTITFGSTNTGVALAEDLEKGLMDRFRSLPIAFWAVPVGRVLCDLLVDVVGLAIMVGVAFMVGFRFHGDATAALGVVALLVLYILAMGSVGALLGSALKSPTMVQTAGFILIFPLTFASSTFVPVSTMPWLLQAVAAHTPVTAMVDLTRHLIMGQAVSGGSVLAAVAWTLGLMAVSIPGAAYFFRRLGR